MKSLLFALPIMVLASTAQAQLVEDHPDETRQIFGQCRAEMGYTGAECQCLMDGTAAALNETQLEYIWVRASRDAEGTRRMNRQVGIFERLNIFLTVRSIARQCAPGKPFNLPDSGGDAVERAVIPR